MVDPTSSTKSQNSTRGLRRSKRKKTCKQEFEDRISSLPDDVLGHILSYIPTKNAVRTSVLSKRWRFVWTKATAFYLDDTLGVGFDNFIRRGINWLDAFMHFVDKVVNLNSVQSIRKFHLRCRYAYDPSRVNAWIYGVITCNIEELDLCISDKYNEDRFSPVRGDDIQLPHSIFGCEKLMVLKLYTDIGLKVPESVHFPNLRVLHLGPVGCSFGDIEKVISGSPLLQEFVFDAHYYCQRKTLYVHSPSLKCLTIRANVKGCYRDGYTRVGIDAPTLEFLDLSNCFFEEHSMIRISSLVRAHISARWEYVDDEPYDQYVAMLIQIFRQISDIKLLHISSNVLETLYYAADTELLTLDDLPTLYNLNHLEVGDCDSLSLHMFPDILKCTPNLKVLAINQCWWSEICPRLSVPLCLSNLEVVELKGFYGWPQEMTSVRYILKNATVLQKLIVWFNAQSLEKKSDVHKKLLKLPRASRSCQIAFS